MAVGERIEPILGFNFRVEIFNIPVASFSEVSGLTAEGDAVDYREGTDLKNTVRKLAGLRKYTNVQLRRGYTENDLLWNWYADIASGKVERRPVAIILMDEAHNDVLRWNIDDAWINKIEGPALKASGNDVAVEMVELVHEGITFELQGAGG
jgi:phage tail-like protein